MKTIFKTCLVIFFLMFSFEIIFCSEEKKEEDYSEGKKLFETKCNQCHSLDRPLSKTKTLEEWKATTSRMAKKTMGGITDEEAVKIAEYLANREKIAKEKKKK